jgi:hypothetical protein
MSVPEKVMILLAIFASLAVIGYSGVLAQPGINEPQGDSRQEGEPCYTAEEATALADAWVSAYSECLSQKDADCTAAYRQAEDQNRACRSAEGCDQACKDECDAALMAALDEYNSCIEADKSPCDSVATNAVPGKPWPVCQNRG